MIKELDNAVVQLPAQGKAAPQRGCLLSWLQAAYGFIKERRWAFIFIAVYVLVYGSAWWMTALLCC